MFIWLTIYFLVLFLNGFTIVYQHRVIRKQAKKLDESQEYATAAILFANTLATRGVGVECDDCGNMITHEQPLDVILRADGTLYVGHRSHNRRSDWGMV